MAFIIIEKGNSRDIGKRFFLGENAIIIGRLTADNNPAVALHDDFISRRHAEISYHQDCFMLRDLESTNGTTIDEKKIKSGTFYPLKHNSIIGLGIAPEGTRVVLRFKEYPTVSTAHIEEAQTEIATFLPWIRVDEEKGEIWVDNKQLSLSRKEYNLLAFLYHKAGKVCQKDTLISEVWPEVADPRGVSDAAIDQLIHRLRMKIETTPSKPKRLISKKGFGYMLV